MASTKRDIDDGPRVYRCLFVPFRDGIFPIWKSFFGLHYTFHWLYRILQPIQDVEQLTGILMVFSDFLQFLL